MSRPLARSAMITSNTKQIVRRYYQASVACVILPLIGAGGYTLTECVCDGHPSIVCHCHDHACACCQKTEGPASKCHEGLRGYQCNKVIVYLSLPTVVTDAKQVGQSHDVLTGIPQFDVSPLSGVATYNMFARDMGPPPDNVLAMHCRLNI